MTRRRGNAPFRVTENPNQTPSRLYCGRGTQWHRCEPYGEKVIYEVVGNSGTLREESNRSEGNTRSNTVGLPRSAKSNVTYALSNAPIRRSFSILKASPSNGCPRLADCGLLLSPRSSSRQTLPKFKRWDEFRGQNSFSSNSFSPSSCTQRETISIEFPSSPP